MTRAYLGLGANLGDREASIRGALARLDATPGIRVVRQSTLRETEPVGGPPQGPYLNGVAEIDTTLPAYALLALCKACERDAGRDFDAERNAPRPLDLDVLLFGDERIDTRDLVVPHPRMHERSFVAQPLAELGVALPPAPTFPRVVHAPDEFTALAIEWTRGDCRTGLVPTMGALHEGHVSLMRRARRECDRVAATIFVNPLQFDQSADLEAYPRDLDRDLAICRDAGVDAVFAPAPASMYPEAFASHVAVGSEAEGMEGAVRAGHFAGVATVVAKLFVVARADRAYFGEKDAQQLAVVRRLAIDLGVGTEIVGCPIVRESDGLAMSSRNARLGPRDRAASTVLHRALRVARDAFREGERSAAALVASARAQLDTEPLCATEYLELRHERTLASLGDDALPDTGARMLVAARFDTDSACETRLIDNMSLAGD